MPVPRCPTCLLPYLDTESAHGVCPACHAPLEPLPGLPHVDNPTSDRGAGQASRRAAPFLLGLFLGSLTGAAAAAAALWAALGLGMALVGAPGEQAGATQAAPDAPAEEAGDQVRRSEAGRPAAEAGRAEAVKAMDEIKQQAAAALEQKGEAERRLHIALARVTEEQGRRETLEKALAEERKTRPAATRSFVRDWQLLGPFASTGEQAHVTVFPPEREPVKLEKAYAGVGGPAQWRPYHSPEDKIDLARFFKYWKAGAAYAVSWAYSDDDRAVTLAVGSDDGVRLWVNGAMVHDVKGGRQARPGQDLVKAHLRKGWNEIRAKVDNIIGTWELYLEFRSAEGGQPLNIRSTSEPPPAAAQ